MREMRDSMPGRLAAIGGTVVLVASLCAYAGGLLISDLRIGRSVINTFKECDTFETGENVWIVSEVTNALSQTQAVTLVYRFTYDDGAKSKESCVVTVRGKHHIVKQSSFVFTGTGEVRVVVELEDSEGHVVDRRSSRFVVVRDR